MAGDTEPGSDSFDRCSTEPAFGYELKAIVDRDGNEHEPGGGGVDMVSLELPIKNVIQNTRLRHDLAQGEIFRNRRTGVGTHSPETVARGFVNNGITDPNVADRLLIVDDYHVSNPEMDRDEPRPCMLPPDKR
ncbi:hypothetical protein [Halorubrum sp. ASP121]|uniref:hypothetical protein n=1 Tax=Halorubrum sp. ASP121 TaxID=1855858 RepID=UPI001F546121|nr:hypothetical protein [Halorubrum sp. ASP121]